uniref:Uncharacterized protein n=1 Tax=Oryza sativa subsp. japonica TaxID=39947 RepID=Q33AF3_ORYSJ|nr:hypothetical protein LOC_Os10g10550 [Oryza sativa Japonica Group]
MWLLGWDSGLTPLVASERPPLLPPRVADAADAAVRCSSSRRPSEIWKDTNDCVANGATPSLAAVIQTMANEGRWCLGAQSS